MPEKMSYRILSLGLKVGLSLAMCAGVAAAQTSHSTPTEADLYCSGAATDQGIPNDTYIISGENSRYKNTFHPGDFVYLNHGEAQGIKIGDEFEVVRPIHDLMPNRWFKWQEQLSKAMGTMYEDVGILRVVHVQPKTATAELKLACDMMQRGDIVRPFVARPVPQFHSVKLDMFAPPSGKKTAMIVYGKGYTMATGASKIVYVNLGSSQGVQVGSYFRVFRYQGAHSETLYQITDTAYKVYGFGSTPVKYQWDDLPRQVLGEGIVLRTSANSSTVLLTTAREEIFAGDYVELE
ncbi:MAG: hypothetical protein LAO08_07325 [Acidobacteriia bacterium]|nr:hypothetical protein [Terriglobia bacterium]